MIAPRQARRTVCFVLETEDITVVSRFQCTLVVVLSTLEHLGERTEVDAEGNRTVAAIQREAIRVQLDRDECDM